MERPKQSRIQNQILILLADNNEPIKSLINIASTLNVHRSSVSRSMHALKNNGLVTKNSEIGWLLTDEGLQEAGRLRANVKSKIEKANQDLVYFNRIANKSFIQLSEYIREFEKKQGTYLSDLLRHQNDFINDIMPMRSYIEAFNKIDQTNSMLINTTSADLLNTFHDIMPKVTLQEIFNQQQSLLQNAFKSLGVFDSFKNVLSSSLINTKFLSVFLDEVNHNLYEFNILESSYLNDLVNILKIPSITEAFARVGKIDLVYSRLLQEANSFITANQYINNISINIPSWTPDIVRQLGQIGVDVSRQIGNLAILRGAPHIDTDLQKLIPSITEITRTNLGLYTSRLKTLPKNPRNIDFIHSSSVTADYVDTITKIVVPLPDENEIEVFDLGITDPLISILSPIGNNFRTMWAGAWESAHSDNPDLYHQAAHSGRELLLQLIDHLAPNSSFTTEEIEREGNGRITHRMQINKILGGNNELSRWAGAVADAVLTGLNTLTAISHYHSENPPLNRSQLIGMLMTLRGLLVICLSSEDTNFDN
jgi:DNA-binding transcriptional regulator YhcF (GntR family)